MRKKALIVFLIIIFSSFLIPPAARADGPSYPKGLYVEIENVPASVAYFDILIPKTLKGASFGSVSSGFQKKHPELMGSQLASYDKDGYISYSMYFKNANSPLLPLQYSVNPSFIEFGQGNYQMLTSFKIVAIDKSGTILKVSPLVNMKPRENGFYVDVDYDYVQNSAQPNFYTSPLDALFNSAALFFILLNLGAVKISFTIAAETLMAIPFKIRPLWLVAVLNLISETVLTVGMFFFNAPYAASVAVFETIVVLIEFSGLMMFGRHPKLLRTAVFVLAANAVTLCLGLLLNSLGVFPI